ncbi:MAG: esterase-like activity of phytase family protein [Roseobacter sp.]|jgi:hypothetical protein|nr:esterase-like activity of phytase family protein [Roseobacter sp.]
MRKRLGFALILACGLAPWLVLLSEQAGVDTPAILVASLDLPEDAEWMGGFSGLETSAGGTVFYAVTDRGHIARGTLIRDMEAPRDITFSYVQRLVDKNGVARDFPHNDAEGVALDAEGRLFVSFEHAHRVLAYDTWDASARWPSYTRSWRALAKNEGLEAVAISDDGTLYTLPERVNSGASEALVYVKPPNRRWQQSITLPVEQDYKPVGADFGPDGRFYLLERQFHLLGFRSRVRAMSFDNGIAVDVETLLHTAWGDHGNLEGLSVWQDGNGGLRLTMVSDDNFLFFMRGQIVEYVIPGRVALP